MNATVKTILIWVLILVAAVTLWNIVEKNKNTTTALTMTELLAKADTKEIEKVTVAGATGNVVGTDKGGREFRSTIPPSYLEAYNRLDAGGVKVTVNPPDTNPWLALLASWILPMLFSFGFGWQCAVWSQQRRLQPPMTTA
jgi:ATP-dependent Zn protease